MNSGHIMCDESDTWGDDGGQGFLGETGEGRSYGFASRLETLEVESLTETSTHQSPEDDELFRILHIDGNYAYPVDRAHQPPEDDELSSFLHVEGDYAYPADLLASAGVSPQSEASSDNTLSSQSSPQRSQTAQLPENAAKSQSRQDPRAPQVNSQKKRRRGMKPEDLQKNKNKKEKPFKCHKCGKGHSQQRDLDRHLVTWHREDAKKMGLDVSKVFCRQEIRLFDCDFSCDNIRYDRLVRHARKVHGLSREDLSKIRSS